MGKIIKMAERPSKINKKSRPMDRTNEDLKKELLARGYYVQAVGRGDSKDIDYLIVSIAPPKSIRHE